jgi:hypothetical protein
MDQAQIRTILEGGQREVGEQANGFQMGKETTKVLDRKVHVGDEGRDVKPVGL